jgi:hypothetical protein
MNTNTSAPVKHTAIWQSVATAIAVILATGVLLVAGSGVAVAKAPPKAKGIVNCAIYGGTGTLNPGLTPAGQPGGVKISFTASVGTPSAACPNAAVTKPKGVALLGGTVTGSGYYKALAAPASASSCGDFDGTDVVGEITVTIAWLTSPAGAIANTTIIYKNNPATVSGSPTDTITLLAPPGTAHKTGSFAAPGSNNTVELKTDLPGPACGAGPFSTFNIVGGHVLV